MKALNETELRSLVTLLDDEDPLSLDLVRREILTIGDPMLPFLDELRAKSGSDLAAKADEMSRQLRFRRIRTDFLEWARHPEPELESGALFLARFGYPGLDTSVYVRWMDRVAAHILDELPSDADAGMTLQRLNSHIFQAMGFIGNEARYYDPDNSYLNRVIETRRGIPVSLSVLYLLLARRLRLPVYGVGTPGHFLVGFRPGPQACFIDTFNRGRVLDLAGVRRMLVRSGYEFRSEFIARCPTREIIVRMVRNLISIYQKMGSTDRAEMLSSLVEVLLTGRPAAERDAPQ